MFVVVEANLVKRCPGGAFVGLGIRQTVLLMDRVGFSSPSRDRIKEWKIRNGWSFDSLSIRIMDTWVILMVLVFKPL